MLLGWFAVATVGAIKTQEIFIKKAGSYEETSRLMFYLSVIKEIKSRDYFLQAGRGPRLNGLQTLFIRSRCFSPTMCLLR
jgi:hypothetical protein